MKRAFIYKRFERFWHWMQALLIITLGLTGFEIHGSFKLFGYEQAVKIHNTALWLFLGLIALAIFWHFTTGEWKQYLPTGGNVSTMVRYYTSGIFRNEPHPYKKTELSKLNPLQRVTYLVFKLVIVPVQVTTGLLYLYYNKWPDWGFNGSLNVVALVHTIGAFTLVVFFIIHLYMITTGRTVTSNLKAMITGWEELEEDTAVQQDPVELPVLTGD
jgi:thiosulfate reductase cytochrome b subunit